jgi:hypothetical protein
MTMTIDGFTLNNPPNSTDVTALAQYHRKQLEEAIFHQEIHLGEYCLEQRRKVHDYTQTLDPATKAEFYRLYDGELKRIAAEDPEHHPEDEAGLSIFAVFIVLFIIAVILYFGVVQNVTS